MDKQTAKDLILNDPDKVICALDKSTKILDVLRQCTGYGKLYQELAYKHLENVRVAGSDPIALDCARFLAEHVGPSLVRIFDITDAQVKKYPHVFVENTEI